MKIESSLAPGGGVGELRRGLSPAYEWEGYLRGWWRRIAEEEAALQKRVAQARACLPALVNTVRQYVATEAYLFASLCRGQFHAWTSTWQHGAFPRNGSIRHWPRSTRRATSSPTWWTSMGPLLPSERTSSRRDTACCERGIDGGLLSKLQARGLFVDPAAQGAQIGGPLPGPGAELTGLLRDKLSDAGAGIPYRRFGLQACRSALEGDQGQRAGVLLLQPADGVGELRHLQVDVLEQVAHLFVRSGDRTHRCRDLTGLLSGPV